MIALPAKWYPKNHVLKWTCSHWMSKKMNLFLYSAHLFHDLVLKSRHDMKIMQGQRKMWVEFVVTT